MNLKIWADGGKLPVVQDPHHIRVCAGGGHAVSDRPENRRTLKTGASSVQFSRSVVSNPLRPHGLQHPRLLCPSPTSRAYSNSCPSSQWAIPPSHPLLFPSPRAFNLSQHQGLFKWVSSLHQVAKVLEFQPQHQPFCEYSGLISFRIDWLDLLAVQETLKSLLQHHSSKALILWCSAF